MIARALLKRWFGSGAQEQPGPPVDSTGIDSVDATLPLTHRPSARQQSQAAASASLTKKQRLERRELLYAVVRESMNHLGVLASTYKFKVLSLDSSGTQYLIMVDAPGSQLGEAGKLVEMERTIARKAKDLHALQVLAVYWRVNDSVASAPSRSAPAQHRSAQSASVAPPPAHHALAQPERAQLPDTAQPHAGPEPDKADRPQPANFADTEIDEAAPPLSGTQYGDLV